MSAQHFLDGEVLPEVDDRDARIDKLERENHDLRAQVNDARREVVRVQQQMDRSLKKLRQSLSPLYRALQMVFGELDAAGVADEMVDPPAQQGQSQPPRVQQVWEHWKDKLGRESACSRMIDALLVHTDMNVPQLRVAMRAAQQTVYDAASKLNKLGLIDKVGGRYSLKKL